jgi:DNA-directed RNA polymerase specialized sigma24 family protein
MANDRIQMRRALEKLSHTERLVCIWKLAGFSTSDIANHLGRSNSAVDALYTRAKRKLRSSLREGLSRHDSPRSSPCSARNWH